jgi:hypothetical protein
MILSLHAPLMGAADSLSDKIRFGHHLEQPIENDGGAADM